MLRPLPEKPDEVRDLLEELYGDPSKELMSPHQRVQTAIERRSPDRVPFDFWAIPEERRKLRDYLGVESDEEVLRLLGIDCRMVVPSYVGPAPIDLEDGTYVDALGTHRRPQLNEFCQYEEYARFPLSEAQTVAEVENYPYWPKPEYWDVSDLHAQIADLNRQYRYHLRYEVGGIFEFAWGLYGFDNYLRKMATGDMDIPNAIMACLTEIYTKNTIRVLEAAGGQIDMVYTYDDIGMQTNLIMSVDMWRRYILPWHLQLNAALLEYDVLIMYHSCGAIYPLIGPLVDEMGIDVLNPLQPRAKGMDMARIKHEFGHKLAFHGGIDLQYTLPHGTPAEVQAEVIDRCRVLGNRGGYICTSAHYLQADVPVENVAAMYITPRTVPG
jgi:uroporphyrinogen decarboxylase